MMLNERHLAPGEDNLTLKPTGRSNPSLDGALMTSLETGDIGGGGRGISDATYSNAPMTSPMTAVWMKERKIKKKKERERERASVRCCRFSRWPDTWPKSGATRRQDHNWRQRCAPARQHRRRRKGEVLKATLRH